MTNDKKIIKIDPQRLRENFRSFHLNSDNVLDFMIEEDSNVDKYMLKLFMLAGLEEYFHIEILKSEYFGNKFNGNHIIEIINRMPQKKFWEAVKNDKSDKTPNEAFEWLNSVDVYTFYYFYIVYKGDINRITLAYDRKIEQSTNLMEKFSYINKRNKAIEFYSAFQQEFEENFNTYYSSQITLKDFINTIQYNTITTSKRELIDTLTFLFKIFNTVTQKKNIIDYLKEDLIFNYRMFICLFEENVLKMSDLDEILLFLRKKMIEFDLYSKLPLISDNDNDRSQTPVTETLQTEYRTNKIIVYNEFFQGVSNPADIPSKMEKVKQEFRSLLEEINDEEYIRKCLKLVQEILQIHPYLDGNGRTCKYLFYFLLIKRSIMPLTIKDSYGFNQTDENLQPIRDLQNRIIKEYNCREESFLKDDNKKETETSIGTIESNLNLANFANGRSVIMSRRISDALEEDLSYSEEDPNFTNHFGKKK